MSSQTTAEFILMLVLATLLLCVAPKLVKTAHGSQPGDKLYPLNQFLESLPKTGR